MYNLTEMTGRKVNENRVIVISTIELKARTWAVVGIAAIPSFALAMMFYPLLHSISLILFPLAEAGAISLFTVHTERGTGPLLWRALLDRQRATSHAGGVLGGKAKIGDFVLCGHKIDLREDEFRMLVANTVPNPDYRPAEAPRSDGHNSPASQGQTTVDDRAATYAGQDPRQHVGQDWWNR
jgi:hypothetical protein